MLKLFALDDGYFPAKEEREEREEILIKRPLESMDILIQFLRQKN